jgi:outer membrane protein assembly factor BamB
MHCHSALGRSATAALAALLLWSCRGLDLVHVSEGYPFFHQLEIFGDCLTVVSPDSKTLRGLTFEGREIWRRSIVGDPLVARYDEGHLYVQQQNTVLRLRAADGTAERLFDVPEHQRFVRDSTYGLVYLTDQRFDRNTFQLLDPDSRRPVWHREDIEQLLHVEKDVVVVATARREYQANRGSYSTRDMAVAGLDRGKGEVRWRLALGNVGGYVRSAVVSPCLVIIDEAASGGLICVDPASGRVLGKRAHSRLPEWQPLGLGYPDVAVQGNQVVFLESDLDGGETLLRVASVPSFEVTQTLQLAGNEPALSLQGDFIFTTGLYRTICFDRRTGKERWQRALVGEWKLIGDRALVSEYDKSRKHARLVSIDLASGSERVLISEPASLSHH